MDIAFANNYAHILEVDITPTAADRTWAWVGPGISNMDPNGNEKIDQSEYYDGGGMAASDVTGGQLVLSVSGHRRYGDPFRWPRRHRQVHARQHQGLRPRRRCQRQERFLRRDPLQRHPRRHRARQLQVARDRLAHRRGCHRRCHSRGHRYGHAGHGLRQAAVRRRGPGHRDRRFRWQRDRSRAGRDRADRQVRGKAERAGHRDDHGERGLNPRRHMPDHRDGSR